VFGKFTWKGILYSWKLKQRTKRERTLKRNRSFIHTRHRQATPSHLIWQVSTISNASPVCIWFQAWELEKRRNLFALLFSRKTEIWNQTSFLKYENWERQFQQKAWVEPDIHDRTLVRMVVVINEEKDCFSHFSFYTLQHQEQQTSPAETTKFFYLLLTNSSHHLLLVMISPPPKKKKQKNKNKIPKIWIEKKICHCC